MSGITVGFSMHPRWVGNGGLVGFLEPLRQAGLSALEFELDANDPDWAAFPPLMDACRDLGFQLTFHAPYRRGYSVAGFAGADGQHVRAAYTPLLELAARLGPAPLVVHGPHSKVRPYAALRDDTVAFLRWLLATFAALDPTLELLEPAPPAAKVGISRAELLQILHEAGNGRLGICWDIGHEIKGGQDAPPDPAWLGRVRHVHIHDLNAQGVDHYPFIFGRVDPALWLSPLVRTGYRGAVVLEIKGEQLGHLSPDRLLPTLASSVRAIAAAVE